MADVVSPWTMLGFSILMTVVGAVLATNYRGLATRHVRAAMRASRRLRRRPEDEAPIILIDRIIGGIFALLGGTMSLLILIDQVIGPGRLIHYGQ